MLVGAGLLVALGLRVVVVEPVRVRTASMAPTLLPGDVVLVWKRAAVGVGDVVLVTEPGDPDRRHLKRVVAGPGQEVELAGGHLYVDGVSIARDRASEAVTWHDTDCGEHTSAPRAEGLGPRSWWVLTGGEHGRERVPAGGLWLLGDNRGNSSDSRHWGAVSDSLVAGRVAGVLWSRSSCGGTRLDRIGAWPEDSRRPG